MFKKGDLVNVKWCDELIMPCTVEGPDEWMPRLTRPDGSCMLLYKVIGKHAKRGNQVSVRVTGNQISPRIE